MTIRLLAVGALCAVAFGTLIFTVPVANAGDPFSGGIREGVGDVNQDGLRKKQKATSNDGRTKTDPKKGTSGHDPNVVMSGARIKF